MSDEHAKATQEVAKAVSKTVCATERLASYLSKYIDEPLELISGIVKDKLAYMRWERQVRLMDRAEAFLESRRLQQHLKPIPPKFAIPLLQAAFLENDNELQDRWAQMLANALDPNWPVSLEMKHITILNELSLYDVKILEKICSTAPHVDDVFVTLGLPDQVLPGNIDLVEGQTPKLEVQISIENMIRLGLLRNETFSHHMLRIRVMALGWDFYKACADKI